MSPFIVTLTTLAGKIDRTIVAANPVKAMRDMLSTVPDCFAAPGPMTLTCRPIHLHLVFGNKEAGS